MTYRKICQAYWEGDLAVALRGDCEAHAVAFYLMTCPASNAIGLYRIALPTICDDLGIDAEVASEALDRLSGERVRNASPTRSRRVRDALQTPFILVDDVYRMLWVVELARHEWGEAPNPQSNQVKGLVKMMDAFASVGRKSALWEDFRARYSPGWDPVFDLMKDAFGTRRRRVGDALETRSRLSLARASGSGTLDPEQDLEEKERAGEPDVVRCTECGKPSPGRVPKGGDGTVRFPFSHLGSDGKPCDGRLEAGIWIREDPDDAANPYGPRDQEFRTPSESSGKRAEAAADEAHQGDEEATGNTREPVGARHSSITTPRGSGAATEDSPTKNPADERWGAAAARGKRDSPKKKRRKGREIPAVKIPPELEAIGIDQASFEKRVRGMHTTKPASAWQSELDDLAPIVEECGAEVVFETWKEAISSGWQGCLPRWVRERLAKGNGGKAAFPTFRDAASEAAEAARIARVAQGICWLCGEPAEGARVNDEMCGACDRIHYGPDSTDPAPEYAEEPT